MLVPQHEKDMDNYIEFGSEARNLQVKPLFSWMFLVKNPHMGVWGNTEKDVKGIKKLKNNIITEIKFATFRLEV